MWVCLGFVIECGFDRDYIVYLFGWYWDCCVDIFGWGNFVLVNDLNCVVVIKDDVV